MHLPFPRHLRANSYNYTMELHALQGKRVLLFGSPRALSSEEFDRLLQSAGIIKADRFDSDIAAVIEGRLVNPIEQEALDRLYTEKRIVPIAINAFEHLLCSRIDPDRIMMSLKLTRDQNRLHSFLQNPYIDDAFFLRLLSLYDWRGEGFFETDMNRDVTAALIGRFYESIERNHNVQYSTLGLMHLIAQNKHPELIRMMGTLPPLRNTLRAEDRQLRAILEALAQHPATDDATLKYFIRQRDEALKVLVAARPALAPAIQHELYRLNSDAICDALSSNPDLDDALCDLLFNIERYARIGYASIRLDRSRFERGLDGFAAALAANPSSTLEMQRTLLALEDQSVHVALAANPALKIFASLSASKEASVLTAMASNPNLPPEQRRMLLETGKCDAVLAANASLPGKLLQMLYKRADTSTLLALAANPSTPLHLLRQLQLDARFERAVRSNEAFGANIKREQIGWL